MPSTTVGNVWNPAIWIPGIGEVVATNPSFITSGAVTPSPFLDAVASGAGTTANVPFFRDLSDDSEAIQVDLGAANVGNHRHAVQVCAILNREIAWGSGALAMAVTGADVVGDIVRQLGVARQKRMQATVIATLRGLYAFGSVPGTNSALSTAASAIAGTRYDISLEAGNSATSANLISSAGFNLAVGLMGELGDSLVRSGAILMHPQIKASLRTQDAANWSTVPLSDQPVTLDTYKGIPVFQSQSLRRAGATNGFVYDTYILGAGAVGLGQKPQVGDQIDVASLQYERKQSTNEEIVYDRTRYIVHVNGVAFTGSPAGQSATNVELSTPGNWALRFGSPDRCGVVQIRTNG